LLLLIAGAACLAILAVARVIVWLEPRVHAADRNGTGFRLAVLGDSDSQSYQDHVWWPEGRARRGGKYHATTLQWTEVLSKLRPEIDQGTWGVWGSRSSAVRIMDWFGVHGRAPRKQDFRHNFAFAGAQPTQLIHGNWRQAPRLVALMDESPQGWRAGVVVIRAGVTSFGYADAIDHLAKDPSAPSVRASMQECLDCIQASIKRIHEHGPKTRIVVVGIFDNSHYPPYFDRWRSGVECLNIQKGLDFFDDELRRLAAADPRIAFFDDRAWFAAHWGSRDAQGMPAYRSVAIGSKLEVKNLQGDDPVNAVLEDGHAGFVWNVLWAQALVDLLIARFDLPLRPITPEEATRFIEAELRLLP